MNKELEKWALPTLRKYQKVLLLDDYLLKFQYSKDVTEDEYMHSIVRFPYKDIIIKYGARAITGWKEKDKQTIKEVLIHELAHTLTNPLYEKSRRRYVSKDEIIDANEHLVDHITNIIIKAGL